VHRGRCVSSYRMHWPAAERDVIFSVASDDPMCAQEKHVFQWERCVQRERFVALCA